MTGRKHLLQEDVTFLVDTREQTPFDFSKISIDGNKINIRRATLTTGDYSILGLERDEICIERKSIDDLCGVTGSSRQRFEKEIDRMLAFKIRYIVVEATWNQIMLGQWRSQVTPAQVSGSLIGWAARGVPFFAANREDCARFTARILWTHARHCYDRLRAFHQSLRIYPHGDVRSSQEEERARDGAQAS